ncbi:triose-phosphate isomerase [Sporanaerobium hydrogeniformans]|uniref:Triose-phosphate isomerase n=1 Tax=Sporanaerobium hydrogeniformans TaxID=3072179 RepID=A0AC61DGK7_9FIRM|nr:triose-phosphate isomerase [Sporanaerobium hydrogeniformans]PHV72108.1 triose-phosphate isomerase [Sporanaerobium hydrogeniformans]
MRKKIVAGNWKMNMTPAKAVELVNTLKDQVNTEAVDVVFCPPFVCLPAVLEATKGTNIAVGAQNMYFEESGAYTGEIAPSMLVELGVKYVILGHSERRQYFAETNETVNKKVLKAIEHNLVPIICVGESLEEREQGITIDLVRLQTKIALKDVKAEDAKKVVIAYEPIWAIGTGKTATSMQAEEVCAAIRTVVAEIYSKEVADEVRVQYGGSVNGGNANELFNMGNIDGGLVGGASLKPEFASIVNY